MPIIEYKTQKKNFLVAKINTDKLILLSNAVNEYSL